MIKILHLSDIHLGSGFSHGKINPETGLNTRFEDFVASLSRCIDRALAEPVDLVLFGGDAFPDATPPPYIQQAFAKEFQRLVTAGIPTVLLVGNHDQHTQGAGGASLCIYRTLGVPSVIVGDRLETHRITTQHGDLQVITLPWLNRTMLMTKMETEDLSMQEVGSLLLDRLRLALEGEIRQLDPNLPTILLAHLMADTATFGAERLLAVGKGFTVPLTFLTRDDFDYVALGHVHKHQILSEQPYVVYPGSIERVDFSEEKEDKGYVLVELEKGNTQVTYCPIPVRSFRTIDIDLTKVKQPQPKILSAIAEAEITDAVVRVQYHLRADQLEQIDEAAIHAALAKSHTYNLQMQLVTDNNRSRLPELKDSSISPITALQTYLNNRNDLADLADPMLEAAQLLMNDEAGQIRLTLSTLEDSVVEAAIEPPTSTVDEPSPQDSQQLRLL